MIRCYDVYGVTMGSDFRFATPLPEAPTGVPTDVVFSCTTTAPPGTDWALAQTVDAQGRRDDGASSFVFVRFGSHDAVRITGAADFHVHDDRIICHLHDAEQRFLVEIALLGMVFALWLERRGTATLHASVVTIDGEAVGFLGNKGGGKTSTLAACMARGHPLLSDDLAALKDEGDGFQVERGFPALRLWPEQARHFLGGYGDLPRLRPDFTKMRVTVGDGGFGRFSTSSARLRRLYLPERSTDVSSQVHHEPVTGQEAVLALVRHSFLPREVQRYGWQPRRLGIFARVAEAVSLMRLRYPAGLHRLPEVVASIEDDLRSGRSPAP